MRPDARYGVTSHLMEYNPERSEYYRVFVDDINKLLTSKSFDIFFFLSVANHKNQSLL